MSINTNFNNYYSYESQNNTTSKVKNKVDSEISEKKTQTLEAFKSEIYGAINNMSVHPSQSKTQISINISDKAFEKMMNDPDYKNEMLRVIQRDLGGVYPAGIAPSYSVIRIGDDCVYNANAMGAAYGDYFLKFSSSSFLEKNTDKSASTYNEYVKKNKQRYYEYQDIAMRQLIERGLQEKQLREKEFEKKIQDKKLYQSSQQQKTIAQYENSICFESRNPQVKKG